MPYYEKLQAIYEEIDTLINNCVTSSSPEFVAWKNKSERLLIKIFGESSYEYKDFSKRSFSLSIWTPGTPDSAWVEACRKGLEKSKAVFSTYLAELKETLLVENTISAKVSNEYSKVFIVHGHDGELRESICRCIEKQGIKPIVLNEQINKGKTIIEKFESHSEVQAAICLFTEDDLGRAKNEEIDRYRARQNVIFETGYFIGKLGRDNVVIITDKDLEIPSDMQGMVYQLSDRWNFDLLRELRSMGFTIDLNKIE